MVGLSVNSKPKYLIIFKVSLTIYVYKAQNITVPYLGASLFESCKVFLRC